MQGSSSRLIGRTPEKVNTTSEKVNTTLPDDIIQEILSRLPARSLLRFRSVHKQWLSLISHPNFVQSNLKHVLSNHPKRFMLLLPNSSQVCSVDYEPPNNNNAVVLFDLPIPKPWVWLTIFGSCNGLFCIGIYGKHDVSAIIWNPLLKNYKKVPNFIYPHPSWIQEPRVGFGYDPLTDDYKLVTVNDACHLVNVYTLKTNLTRSLPFEPSSVSTAKWSDNVGTLFNASIYWIADEFRSGSGKLARFDLIYEKFTLVDVPALDQDRSLIRKTKLVVARGCLCMFAQKDFNNRCLNLLMMKEDKYNVVSWSKGAEIRLPYGLLDVLNRPISILTNRPISILTNGEILMQVVNRVSLLTIDGSGGNAGNIKSAFEALIEEEEKFGHVPFKLILYNPYEERIKIIPIHVAGDWYEGTTYHETFVSPS